MASGMLGGLEVVGGVAVVGAVTGWIQKRRDAKELATEEDYRKHREAHAGMEDAHKEMTKVWGGSLSLFEEKDALEAGEHRSIVRIVLEAKRMAEEAAELYDRADVYEAQFAEDQRDERIGVKRGPVNKHTERMKDLQQRLVSCAERLKHARDKVDSPTQRAELQSSPISSEDVVSPPVKSTEKEESPMRILRKKGQVGLAYGSIESNVKDGLKQNEAFDSIDAGGLERCDPMWA